MEDTVFRTVADAERQESKDQAHAVRGKKPMKFQFQFQFQSPRGDRRHIQMQQQQRMRSRRHSSECFDLLCLLLVPVLCQLCIVAAEGARREVSVASIPVRQAADVRPLFCSLARFILCCHMD